MKERPILFSGDMVLAILSGRKTQTRRVIKPQPPIQLIPWTFDPGGKREEICWYAPDPNGAGYGCSWGCPYGQPGDHLWVREAFTVNVSEEVLYLADWKASGAEWEGMGWKPSIHMPRYASRINLEVTGVRVERVQDIKLDDVEAEGFFRDALNIERFMALWDSTYAKRGYGWDTNPYVWIIEFKRV